MFNSPSWPKEPFARLQVGVLIVALTVALGCTAKRRKPKCFVFPPDYVGWVSIEYGNAGSKSLPEREGCVWIDFRERVDRRTSDDIEEGWATDRYLQDISGQFVPIREGSQAERAVQEHFYHFVGMRKSPNTRKEYLFIGTAQDRRLKPPPI